VPEEVEFQTKPEIALGQIDRALANGVCVAAWTFDELYGRDGKFLDGLESRQQTFVAEVPVDFHGWVREPKILPEGPENTGSGRAKHYPRLAVGYHSSEVRNLAKHSLCLSQTAMETLSNQRFSKRAAGVGDQVGRVLAERSTRIAWATTHADRGAQRAERRDEVFPRERHTRRRRSDVAMAVVGRFRSLVDRALFPGNER